MIRISDDPAVSAATAKLNQLKQELSQVERELETAGSANAVNERDRAAQALLDGNPVDGRIAGNVDELRNRLAVLRRAVDLQGQAVANTAAVASEQVCKGRRPEILAILKKGAKALASLRDFVLAERGFRDELLAAGVSFASTLRPMPVGRMDETDIDRWLAEAGEHYGL